MSTEVALAAPLLVLILLIITQFALWSHATHIAQTAAAEGLSATRVHTGTSADGEARARDAIGQRSDGPLRDAAVHAIRGDVTAQVEVTGVAASVLPFLRLRVHAEATGPVERFIPDMAEG